MSMHIRRVLAALKPWQASLPLSAYHARFLSERLGAELRLLSCVFDTDVAVGMLKGDSQALSAQVGLIASERAVLADLARSLEDWGVEAAHEVRWGQPVEDVIVDEARRWHADLLVVGTHQGGVRPHTRLSRVDWQLMRSCPCAILLARDPQFEGYETILAAIDPLHRHSQPEGIDRRILEFGATLARAAESEFLVAHVYPDPALFTLASAVEVMPGVYYGAENIEHAHREAVTELAAEYGPRGKDVLLVSGDPGESLVSLIDEHSVDLIIMGALKRGIEERILGSTVEDIVANAQCDVLLVGPPSP
jgi:universal stress protein E